MPGPIDLNEGVTVSVIVTGFIQSPTPPADITSGWIDQNTGVAYVYSTVYSKWISFETQYYRFYAQNATPGTYLYQQGQETVPGIGHSIPRCDGVVLEWVSLNARVEEGDVGKSLDISVDEETPTNFPIVAANLKETVGSNRANWGQRFGILVDTTLDYSSIYVQYQAPGVMLNEYAVTVAYRTAVDPA